VSAAAGRLDGRRLHPATKAATALLAGVALFLLTAVMPVRGNAVAIVVIGGLYVSAIVLAALRTGPTVAVALAVAAGLAFDSFFIPPTRAFDADNWQNWIVIATYLSLGLLAGMLAERAQRRAEASHASRWRLGREQEALRRVATLVARGVPAKQLFDAVTAEVGRLLGADLAGMVRYKPGLQSPVADWSAVGSHPHIGGRWPLDGDDPGAVVARTGQPVRIDDYTGAAGEIAAFIRERLGISSTVASPIVVEGELWGALGVHTTHGRVLPPDAAAHLANFTELVGTSISNANARDEVARLAEEQAALRRVATLVARESPQAEVFAAIAEELGRLMAVDHVRMLWFEADGTATTVASAGELGDAMPLGARERMPPDSLGGQVHRSGRSARVDDYAEIAGRVGRRAREIGVGSAVATPIVVEGRLWGAMVAASRKPARFPAESEARMHQFTELLAIAIANLHARAERDASRARIVEATDLERRRVVRDLHDGAQQRLVHTVVTLKLAERALDRGDGDARSLVTEALAQANRANAELRELAHGILPAALTRGGLRAGVDALVSRIDLPVDVDVTGERYPPGIEASAYFVVAEALTNVLKHARAERAAVTASAAGGVLHLQVRDNGVGGASPEGHGLTGVEDRVTALGGTLDVDSPPGRGTLLEALLPLPSWGPQAAAAPPESNRSDSDIAAS
jgi:signal transduction histidine kinase